MAMMKEFFPHAFQPIRGLKHPWLQTVAANYIPEFASLPSDINHRLTLDDGDKLVVSENTPLHWQDGDRIIVMVHGLTGSSQSNYMIRIGLKMVEMGYKVIRVNLRSCGEGFGLAKLPFHSGRSEDTRKVLEWLARYFPHSPVTQIGFSLGGNITLKMVGEQHKYSLYNLDSAMAISPPADLISSAKHVSKPGNHLFERYFVKRLVKFVHRVHDALPDLSRPEFPSQMSIKDFDEIYTAPRCGFQNAEDYYHQSSAIHYFENIKTPTYILSALDDPIVDSTSLLDYKHTPNFEIILTKQGGHLGFLGDSLQSIRWMDHAILNWMHRIEQH